MKRIFYGCAIIATAALPGCKDEHVRERSSAPSDLNAQLTSVSAGRLESGFKHGHLRQHLDVGGFSISKYPITLKQMRACVAAGACTQPVLQCANPDGDDQDAARCVGNENAKQYCAWSDARLPHLTEWMLAARGSSVQRFAWGDAAATCEQHPLARPLQGEGTIPASLSSRPNETYCGEPNAVLLRVGVHAKGASPSGLEDVLLAEGELIGGHAGSHFAACGRDASACIVHGLTPGGIDSVEPLAKAPEVNPRVPVKHPYTFRCVWTEES